MENPDDAERDTALIEQNFAEIAPAMSGAEALAEASRCLYCYDAPCTRACPTHIDVPSFIKKIASGNLTGSARVIFDANPIGSTCAKVCPVDVLCEGACVEKTLVNKPIEIGRLQRYATDHALLNGKDILSRGEPNGLSVGIVGSGPAGLSCAAYLARLGYGVTIYDRREIPGGLNTYGMAEYKMTQADAVREAEMIGRLGVEFRLNCEVGRDISFAELESEHNAVFVGIGLGQTNMLGIPGEELANVIDAMSFIEQVKTRDWDSIFVGKNVVVIGGGNTAIDAATQARRLGAEKVTMMYRRSEAEAPAYAYELEIARRDGVEFLWQTTPTGFGGFDRVLSMRVRGADGGEYKIACDMAIKAIGQRKQGSFLRDVAGIETDEAGRAVVDERMQTSKPNVFAGGDCVNGGAEAVDAAQMGKHAAAGIHRHLTGEAVPLAGADKIS